MLLRSVELKENMEDVVSGVMVGPLMVLRLGQGDAIVWSSCGLILTGDKWKTSEAWASASSRT